ncbi:MAG: sigma-54 interaction domain-containing protein [Nitrospinaceae bacterium]
MDTRKPLTVLESAFPFVFFTESFADPMDFRNVRMEFVKNNLRSRKTSEIPANQRVEDFFRSIFAQADQLGIFLKELEKNGKIQEFEITLNPDFSLLKYCQLSCEITRLQKEEYYLQGHFIGIQKMKELERALQEENTMMESILSGIGDAVCVYDTRRNVLFQSPLHKRWFSDPTPYMHFKQGQNGGSNGSWGKPNRFVVQQKNGDKKELSLEITAYPIKDQDGQPFAGINIVRDLSLVLELEAKSQELERIKQARERGEGAFKNILGESPAIRRVLEGVEKISRLNTVVFIQGDTGTGKELIARAIQELSPRANKPFVTINCGALPETLLDSELFGHTKGAFTGADTETTGLFEAADGGTIFLDEIGELSIGTQVKLLRVLQDGEIRKLGSTRSKKVDVRVITATHRNIEDLVLEKKFRQDLFYRIHVFKIQTPPLRERDDDVLLLADHFLREFAGIQNKNIRKISKAAGMLLKEYSWPGNIRELRNVIERATILCESDTLQVKDLPLSIKIKKPAPRDISPVQPEAEPSHQNPIRKKILDSLHRNRWNKTLTAKELSISRATLWRKMKELSIHSA